jgi:hypothetical protein
MVQAGGCNFICSQSSRRNYCTNSSSRAAVGNSRYRSTNASTPSVVNHRATSVLWLSRGRKLKRDIEREDMARIGEQGFEQLLQLLTQLLQNDNTELVC